MEENGHKVAMYKVSISYLEPQVREYVVYSANEKDAGLTALSIWRYRHTQDKGTQIYTEPTIAKIEKIEE